MTLRGDEDPDDQLLIRFLTGELPETDAERLEERSVADDALAARLDAVENDLADAYVRGELDPATRARFEAAYGSRRGRRKVATAAALFERERRESAGAGPRRFGAQAASTWFALAAAAALLVVASWTFLESRTRAATEVVHEKSAGVPRPPLVEIAKGKPAGDLPAAPASEPAQSASRSPMEAAPTAASSVVSFVLFPQTRGESDLAVVRVPRGSAVSARLQLELDEMAHYGVALKEAAGRTLWQSGRLESIGRGDDRALEVRLPPGLLRPGAHTFEVSGIADDGSSEFVGSYAFRAVLE